LPCIYAYVTRFFALLGDLPQFMVVSTPAQSTRTTMWLPSPVYERVPQFWLLLGLLFMSSGFYLGFGFQLSYFYFVVGFSCVIWSIVTLIMRRRHRGSPADTVAAPTEEDHND
jgi:hypothetical protein